MPTPHRDADPGDPAAEPLTAGEAVPAMLQRALASHHAGRLDAAERLYREVLARVPDQFDALHLSGVVAMQRGDWASADTLISRARHADPRSAEACSNHFVVLKALRRYDDALASCDRAIALAPALAVAHHNRGIALALLGRHDEALASFERTLALQPDDVPVLLQRGVALATLTRHAEAIDSFDRVLVLAPGHVDALNARGGSLNRLARYAEALASYDRALELRPQFAPGLYNRGALRAYLGRHAEALADLEGARSLDAGLPYLDGMLLRAKLQLCDWRDFDALRQRVVDGVRAGGRSADPLTLIGLSDSLDDQRACAQAWVRDKFPESALPAWRGERYRHARIRVAYLSTDLRDHPVAHLAAGLFEAHDRSRFETTAVSFGVDDRSALRARLERAFDRFIDARTLSDGAVAALLRELEIDIAVDLNGHTSDARTGVFALRPAPIQVGYLGFPGTMGASYIDCIVADRCVVPDESCRGYAEEVVRLPDCFLPSDAQRVVAPATPTRAEAGLPAEGFVFCSFNNIAKITPEVFGAWMRILRAVPGSVLWLREGSASAVRNLRAEAASRGVAPESLAFAPRVASAADHLARHRLAGLFLDTWPYNAHTTASDALWAGLPVLTLRGEAFAARVAGSLLEALGLRELVAASLADYESMAIGLAASPPRLAAIRERLARHRTTHPLFDTPRICRNLEAAYVALWERWQRTGRVRS